MELEIYEKSPEGFIAQVEVSGCYLEIKNKVLLLQNAPWKSEGGAWGLPAGKLELGETPEAAAQRELFEEIGLSLSSSQIYRMGSLYIRKAEIDFIFHVFKIQLDQIPAISLSEEHQSYRFATLKELNQMPLMIEAREVLARYCSLQMQGRMGASVNAYLILKKREEVLLQLRKNTGYADGQWSLVAGHVEDGESATDGMIRETLEEIGLKITSSQLTVVHVMHRQTNRLNIDLFFACTDWEGVIENREIEKCERLAFFPLSSLPIDLIDYNRAALEAISRGEFYSERGF